MDELVVLHRQLHDPTRNFRSDGHHVCAHCCVARPRRSHIGVPHERAHDNPSAVIASVITSGTIATLGLETFATGGPTLVGSTWWSPRRSSFASASDMAISACDEENH